MPFLRGHAAGVLEVLDEMVAERPGGVLVLHKQGILKVVAQADIVHIHTADEGDFPVDDRGLAVDHATIEIEFHAHAQVYRFVVVSRPVRVRMIGRAGYQDDDAHALSSGVVDGAVQSVIGNEIRSGDQYLRLGAADKLDQLPIEHTSSRQRTVGEIGHFFFHELLPFAEDLAFRKFPHPFELAGHIGRRLGAFDARHRLPPVTHAVVEAYAADMPHRTIDDDRTAMSAKIPHPDILRIPWHQMIEERKMDACLEQFLLGIFRSVECEASHRVGNEAHPHPLLGFVAQGVDET